MSYSVPNLKRGLELLRCPLTSDIELNEATSVPGSELRLRLIEWLIRKYDDTLLDKVGDTPFPTSAKTVSARPPSISPRTQRLCNGAHVLGLCPANDYGAIEGYESGHELLFELANLLHARISADDADAVAAVSLDNQTSESVSLLHSVAKKQASIFAETATFVLPNTGRGKRGAGKSKSKANIAPDYDKLKDTLASMKCELDQATKELEQMLPDVDVDNGAYTAQEAEELSKRLCATWRDVGALIQGFNATYKQEIESWTHVSPPVPTELGPYSRPILARFEEMREVIGSLNKTMGVYRSMKNDGRCSAMLQAQEFGDAEVFALMECTEILKGALNRNK